MHVLHVIPAIAPRYGGPSQLVIELCRSLEEQGVSCCIASTNANGDCSLDVETNAWTKYSGIRTIFFHKTWNERFKYSHSMARWLGRHVSDFDLVHIHAIFSHSTIAGGRSCIKAGVPFIVRPLGSLDPWSLQQNGWMKSLLLKLGLMRILKGAAAIHYTTALEKQAAESALGLEGGWVVANAVSLPALVQERGSHEPFILYMGRLHRKKKLDLLIESFSRVMEEPAMQDVSLVIAGSGDSGFEDKLKSLADQCGCQDRVKFMGWVEGDQKHALLQGASLQVLISENENYGISAVEAMAVGTPVLVNRGVYIYPEIEKWDAGWICEDEADLPDLLCRVMGARENAVTRGKNARKLVQDRYTWPVVAGEMSDLYREILAS